MTTAQKFIVIGMEDRPLPPFPEEVLARIRAGKVFSGGKRHRELVRSLLPADARWIDITVPLDEVLRQYAPYPEIVVFASGDPLFFGFAVTLRNRIPGCRIELFPAFNSLQKLAHRLVLPYHDMRIVSLTGRPWHEFDRALIERAPKIGLLTDRAHTPEAIASRMLDYGYGRYTAAVGEHLGHPERERISRLSLQELAGRHFEQPNCLILVQDGPAREQPFGIPEEAFEPLDGRINMITKMPIRLLSLHKLDLNNRNRFWDIGFCTGSVSIEARLRFPHLHITAFEIRREGERLMDINSKRFGAPGIVVRTGDFLEEDFTGITPAEAPEAVFIGGHGGRLREMIGKLRPLMPPGGIIVFNSVSEQSGSLFRQAAEENGMILETPSEITADLHNPIRIYKAAVPGVK